jgi:hypothetical protein
MNISLEMHSFRVFKACLCHSPPAWIQASAWHLIATRRQYQIPGMLHIVWKPTTIQFRRFPPSSIWVEYTNDFKWFWRLMILNGSTSRNPVDLNQVSLKARELIQLYLSTHQETFVSDTYGQWDWNVQEHHHAWSAVLDIWLMAH